MTKRQTTYDAIYLSPHLDDAALSCGGQIFNRTSSGQSVLIVSVMAGDPVQTAVSNFAHSLHQRWELNSNIVAARRAEDILSCNILGADYLHWNVPDCIYRVNQTTGTAFYDSEETIFGDVHPIDKAQLYQPLLKQLHSLPPHKQLLVPLTIGHHVDHLLIRQVVETYFGNSLFYYEDYPYAQEVGALESAIDKIYWYNQTIKIDEGAIQAKINAISAFESQLSTFFNGRSDLEQQIKAFWQQVGGERLWQKHTLVPTA